MSEELIDRKQVQEMFSLTTKQFGRVMRNIERRHPLESWIKRIKENNKEKVYIKQECVEWLKEVYFNKEEHYLTLEIEFYKKRIYALEQELGIISQPKKYQNTLLRFLDLYFNKSVGAIHVALHRMKKAFPYPITFEDGDIICIKEEGVRWLHENYFKREYLKELEEYKWELENSKNPLPKSFRNIISKFCRKIESTFNQLIEHFDIERVRGNSILGLSTMLEVKFLC